LWNADVWAFTSVDAAPGTATLLRMSVARFGFRSAHVVDVPLAVRVPSCQLMMRGGHPGVASAGKAKRVPIWRASRTAYDWDCDVESIPSD
jgi:hypothetical protein